MSNTNKLFSLVSSLTKEKFKNNPTLNIDNFWNNLVKDMNLYDNFTFEFIPADEPNIYENQIMIGNLKKILEIAYKIGILQANPEINPFRYYSNKLYELETHVPNNIITVLDNLIKEEHFVQVRNYFEKN